LSLRRLPVRPNLDQLKHQAKDLFAAFRAGDPVAIAEFREHHPERIDLASAKLADAQLVLARSYQASSWTRLVQAVDLIDAIWDDNLETVRTLVTSNRHLLHEATLIRKDSNWGPPMTYAANLGVISINQMLNGLGAMDHRSALARAVLQAKSHRKNVATRCFGNPVPPDGALAGPAYTLSVEGTSFALGVGARVHDDAASCSRRRRRDRDRWAQSSGEACDSRTVRATRRRVSGHAYDGAAQRANRSSHRAPAAGSEASQPHV